MRTALANWLHDTLDRGQQPTLPPPVALFHCQQPQHIHNVPLHYPSLIFVLDGVKQLHLNGELQEAQAGEVIMLPPGHIALANLPPANGRYLALTLALPEPPPATEPRVRCFSRQQARWTHPAPAPIWLMLQQWIDGHHQHSLPENWHAGRSREIRDHLLASGNADHLTRYHTSAQQQVLSLIYGDLSKPWRLADAARQLCCSDSTLQRQLARESTSFSALLEEARMVSALGMLQGSQQPIQLIAENVGYQSASRFAERFRDRFGLLPSTLRDTHQRQDEVSER
ncbi:helix-turn-helix transcriptional regulator [Marinobacter xestospongiae]|uniref:Helix-turn-helix domain-containing protein n=1 Tax=Marinobacter xestospongiae TaxID=994319 RepID=A0ABU3W0C0_9GAMM|nr:helix-turn-helix domain-containing protein [Marinobacter xestospongiae]MDV2079984.1 helix-turn-helix domain-containing protein [Marinobacter xestospongiae]